MKLLRKNWFSVLCLLLTAAVLAGTFLLSAGATAADEQEADLLSTLCQKYESSGPGAISGGAGDPGGKSYGSFQFSSNNDKPKDFFNWCRQSSDSYYQSIGNRLYDAYYEGTPGYGSGFDSVWRQLAAENNKGFWRAQRDYTRHNYYDPAVSYIEENIPGFKVSNYSIALRNVIWSRAVQHGTYGCYEVVQYAVDTLGGFTNQPESELIDAIYKESGEVRPRTESDSHWMSGDTAERYGVSDMVLSWYHGSSGDVQIGVYLRLRVNEVADAQRMLVEYGYEDAPIPEGNFYLLPATNTNLGAVADGSSVSLNEHKKTDSQSFRLTYYASGYYTIESLTSGQRLTADSGGKVYLADATADPNQMWKPHGRHCCPAVADTTGQRRLETDRCQLPHLCQQPAGGQL